MEENKPQPRRLVKKPPPSSFTTANFSSDVRVGERTSLGPLSLRSQRSTGSLQRNPSAPYPRSQPAYGHVRKTTSPNPATFASSSSNSSLDRQISGPSPVLQSPEFPATTSGLGGASPNYTTNSSRPLSEKTSQELIGAPFDGSGILNHIDSTKASGYQNSQRRPPPPPLSYTSPNSRMTSPPRVGENQIISPKRYSDENPKAGIKKRTGFSGFMNSFGVGSPRSVKISAPENPVHVTHVGYDNTTGQFTVSGPA